MTEHGPWREYPDTGQWQPADLYCPQLQREETHSIFYKSSAGFRLTVVDIYVMEICTYYWGFILRVSPECWVRSLFPDNIPPAHPRVHLGDKCSVLCPHLSSQCSEGLSPSCGSKWLIKAFSFVSGFIDENILGGCPLWSIVRNPFPYFLWFLRKNVFQARSWEPRPHKYTSDTSLLRPPHSDTGSILHSPCRLQTYSHFHRWLF